MKIKDLNSWVEISESAYAHNLAFFKKIIAKNTELAVVIKANAYGHGMLEIARLATKYDVHSFCVHSLDEAVILRKSSIQGEILIMGPVLLSQLDEVIKNNFRLVLYNIEHLNELIKLTRKMKKKVRVHLKLETGTYRQGISENELPEFLQLMKKYPLIKVESVYSHFANIEDTTIHDYALYQLKKFNEMKGFIQNHGFTNIKAHVACSAAAMLFPETHFDMVRIGISQYGLWSSRETFVSYKTRFSQNSNNILHPVLSWKTRVSQIKTIRVNQYIGYGCTFKTTRESKIAILPVGYADGYDRGLSNQSYVLINGKRAPVRGRICMNLIIVDITDIPDVKLEDEVVLIGKQGNEIVTVDYLAGLIGTINYEFVTRINWNIPRIVVN
jgi:alanine racemase